jgi:hypothetical protein
MSGESPDVILYDSNSNALAVQNGVAIPASTPALMIAGSDGTNSRYITIDTSGRPVVVGAGVAGTPAGGVITIQGIAGGTSVPVSGTITANQGTPNTLTNAWPYEITDGINGPVSVKPASTSAAITDVSLVVAISPNSIAYVQGAIANNKSFTGNPLVTGGVDFNGYVQQVSASMINGLTNINVIDLQAQNKLDNIILLLSDIRDILFSMDSRVGKLSSI